VAAVQLSPTVVDPVAVTVSPVGALGGVVVEAAVVTATVGEAGDWLPALSRATTSNV
jgi:hypothetical protein